MQHTEWRTFWRQCEFFASDLNKVKEIHGSTQHRKTSVTPKQTKSTNFSSFPPSRRALGHQLRMMLSPLISPSASSQDGAEPGLLGTDQQHPLPPHWLPKRQSWPQEHRDCSLQPASNPRCYGHISHTEVWIQEGFIHTWHQRRVTLEKAIKNFIFYLSTLCTDQERPQQFFNIQTL